jgi:hypothetical protein
MNRLRIAHLNLVIWLSKLGRKDQPVGCCACRGPFRHLWMEDGVAVCDDHLVVNADDDYPARVEFLAPFEPMTKWRFFLLLDAADEGWLPAGAVRHENAHAPCADCVW